MPKKDIPGGQDGGRPKPDYYELHCEAFHQHLKNVRTSPEDFDHQLSSALEGTKEFLDTLDELGFETVGHYRACEMNWKFSFPRVHSMLQKIPSNVEKLKFLYRLHADYLRESRGLDREAKSKSVSVKTPTGMAKLFDSQPRECFLDEAFWTFKDDVEIEIEKLKKFQDLEGLQDREPSDTNDREPAVADNEDDVEQLKRRVVILLIEELIPKFSELIPAQKAEFLALLTGRSKKGFELIVEDHRYASNFKQIQRSASVWLEKLGS